MSLFHAKLDEAEMNDMTPPDRPLVESYPLRRRR